MPFSHLTESGTPAACWDPWVLQDEHQYRLYYLSGAPDQVPWWKTSWICGAISTDFNRWQPLGPILEPLPDRGWESGRLFAGSCYKQQGQYALFYSAASEAAVDQEAIGLAISADGTAWQRLTAPLLALPPAPSPYGRCNRTGHLHWRDPAVQQVGDRFYLYFCASLAVPGAYQGGLGLAVADQITGPYKLLPPAAGPSVATAASWPFYHLERPQIVFVEDRYHLFFSCFKEFVNPVWLEQIGPDRVTDSTLYWYVSDRITGPFEPVATLPVVPGSDSTGLYGTQFFVPAVLDRDQCSMSILGWYYKTYTLSIAEFSVAYQLGCFRETLRIVTNFQADSKC